MLAYLTITVVSSTLAQAKLPIPDAKEQAKLRTLLQQNYKDAYARADSDPAAAKALAGLLLSTGKQAVGVERFVRFCEARDLASRVGELDLAFTAITELHQSFAIDPDQERLRVLQAGVQANRAAKYYESIVKSALHQAAAARAQDKFPLAREYAKVAQQAAGKGGPNLPGQVNKAVRDLEAAAKAFAAMQTLADRLKKNPDDQEANLALGRILCFQSGKWEKGRYYLAQGSDRTIRLLAQRDLAPPEEVKDLIELGDAWWDLGAKEKDAQDALQARAAFWYEKVVFRTQGAVRARLEQRIQIVRKQTVPVWDHDGPPGEVRRFDGHQQAVYGLAFTPDGRRIVTASLDHTVVLWDASSGKLLHRLKGHTDRVWTLAGCPRTYRAVTGGLDKTLRWWDLAEGKEQDRWALPADIQAVALSADGAQLLCGSDHVLYHWNVATRQVRWKTSVHTSPISAVAFSPDGTKALTGGLDQNMILFDVKTGQVLRRFPNLPGWLRSVAFTPDGKQALASGDRDVVLWDLETGKEARRLRGPGPRIYVLILSPDGRRLVTGDEAGNLCVWDLAKGQQLHRFQGPKGPIYTLAFSPLGGRFLSAHADNSVRLWGLPR